ncbi:MAG TPA: 2-phospho-L-lactate guanylyltransferase [Microlunatus sp.]|nr:2-phospho-L-lactate guanylyltransferase [Microlunatus sp.]
MEAEPAMRSGAVVALKPLRAAKTRLQGVPVAYRQHIAWCLASDTIGALAAALDRVVVVSNEPSLATRLHRWGTRVRVVPEGPSLGMNAALAAGARQLADGGMSMVVACVGDLPCLRPVTVRHLVAAAAHHPRSFVADTSGTGSTMLFARGGSLDPRFQGPSAAAHRGSGATALTESDVGPLADARRDVDTVADLLDAERIGLGEATAALFDQRTHRMGRFAPVVIDDPAGEDELVVRTPDGVPYRVEARMLADQHPHMAPGQRLHAALVDDRVLSIWL